MIKYSLGMETATHLVPTKTTVKVTGSRHWDNEASRYWSMESDITDIISSVLSIPPR